MAAPVVALTSLAGAGFLAADVTASNPSTHTIVVAGIFTVVVALIGLIGTFWGNRRRNRTDEPVMTLAARVAVLETNQAEMQSNIREILEHVRPWPKEGHR